MSNTETETKVEIKTETKIDGIEELFKSLFKDADSVKVVGPFPRAEESHSCDCEFKKEILQLIVGYLKTMKNQQHDGNKYRNGFIHLKHVLQVFCTLENLESRLHWEILSTDPNCSEDDEE